MKPIEIKVARHGSASPKLSWEETAREMAAAAEDWGPWDATVADGLEDLPWGSQRPGRVAEMYGA